MPETRFANACVHLPALGSLGSPIPHKEMANMTEPRWIIRTHDRIQFKNCRLAWDWGSKLRQDYEPNTTDDNLLFGTAVHAGLAEAYDPQGWGAPRSVRLALALQAFVAAYPRQENADPHEWAERIELGKGMLAHYFEWAEDFDAEVTPISVEAEFEVPVPDPQQPGQQLYVDGIPVFYQGRIDALFRDSYGGHWITDWKTAIRVEGDHEWLQMDEQISSYCWAMQAALGVKIEGFLYVELLKALPLEPRVLKNGTLSLDKSQNTTLKKYLDKLAEMGYSDVDSYSEILESLRVQGNKFFRRTQVHRSPRELELIGERIGLEALDILSDPSIYPNPNKFRCGRCSFKAACLARADGSDYQWILSDNFHKRSEVSS